MLVDIPKELPKPDSIAQAHSEKLIHSIIKEMNKAGNSITFSRFMELALYSPGLGYYSAGAQKLGRSGDFITAPEISPLFAQCLARQCQQVFNLIGDGHIVEFGAGSGVMAAELLQELERLDGLPQSYKIIEISADLRLRQEQILQEKIPHLINRVEWLNELPQTSLKGVILANEVLDAMPVHRFCLHESDIQEFYVGWNGERFIWQLGEVSSVALLNLLTKLKKQYLIDANSYASEVNMLAMNWIQSVSAFLTQGLVLLVDYGFPQAEYYHSDRTEGTLMCHYRHRTHADPLILVGLQDITAHVDFTAVAEAAVLADMQVLGYTSQANFLLNCGLLDLIAKMPKYDNLRQQYEFNHQIQLLTSHSEMGEICKVVAFGRNLAKFELIGFSQYDRRMKL